MDPYSKYIKWTIAACAYRISGKPSSAPYRTTSNRTDHDATLATLSAHNKQRASDEYYASEQTIASLKVCARACLRWKKKYHLSFLQSQYNINVFQCLDTEHGYIGENGDD